MAGHNKLLHHIPLGMAWAECASFLLARFATLKGKSACCTLRWLIIHDWITFAFGSSFGSNMRLRCLKNIPPPREHNERGGGGGEERRWKTKLLEDGRLCTFGNFFKHRSMDHLTFLIIFIPQRRGERCITSYFMTWKEVDIETGNDLLRPHTTH
ncbi:hypothetical protein B0T13DRAFT_244567 [Neurospora crassa]|nr:hypothetical protein B0T13DRAFT_244567 [Neurospora crassa]